MVAVLSASMFAYYRVSFALPETAERVIAGNECVAVEGAALPPARSALERDRMMQEVKFDCMRSAERWVAMVVGLGLLALAFVVVAVYVLIPTWKIRRRRLVPLEEDDAPELVTAFHDICRQSGREHPPGLLWNPLAPGAGALAFGRFNRPYVAVGAGLVVQYYTEPLAATAVLRHELAHVVNRDVSKTYLAMSLWYGFVVAALLPLLAVQLFLGGALPFPILWRLLALIVLVYAARNALLRAREYYADSWAGSSPPLRTALAAVLEHLPNSRRSGLRSMWGLHPDPSARIASLRQPDRLFRPSLGDVVAAGVLAGFAYPMVAELLFLVMPLEYTLYIGAGAALPSASLIGVVLGTVAWRAGLAARAHDRRRPGAAPLAVAATLGFTLGAALSFLTGRGSSVRSSLILMLFMLLSVHWLLAVADAWFDAVPWARTGRLFSFAGLVAAALVVWSTGWVSYIGTASQADAPAAFYAGYVGSHSFTPFVIAGLVSFPLAAAWLRRRVRSDEVPAWVAGDQPGGDLLRWPHRVPLQVMSAMWSGAVGGTVFCAGVVALWALDVSPRSLVEPVDEVAFQYAPGLDYAPVALAVATQFVVVGVVSLRAKRLPVLHALLALPTALVLLTGGVALRHVLEGDGIPVDLRQSAKLIAMGAAMAALVVGGIVGAVTRRSHAEAPDIDPAVHAGGQPAATPS